MQIIVIVTKPHSIYCIFYEQNFVFLLLSFGTDKENSFNKRVLLGWWVLLGWVDPFSPFFFQFFLSFEEGSDSTLKK